MICIVAHQVIKVSFQIITFSLLCLFDQGAYADVASYMVMTEESVNDLNSRLVNPVTEHHFRPNLVVKGCPAYSEDSWDWLRVNDVILRSFKYCTRSETYLCVLILLND